MCATFLLQTLCGWVLTLVVAALLCGGLSAFTMYAPQKTASDDIYTYNKALGADSLAMIRQLNSTFPFNGPQLQVGLTPVLIYFLSFRKALKLLE